MTDRFEPFWIALTIVLLVGSVFLYYSRVVKPADEVRWEIIACMDAAGDLHSKPIYEACRKDVVSRR